MQIAFALLIVVWWIALWGLSDLLVEDWTREEKLILYVSALVVVSFIIYLNPDLMKKL